MEHGGCKGLKTGATTPHKNAKPPKTTGNQTKWRRISAALRGAAAVPAAQLLPRGFRSRRTDHKSPGSSMVVLGFKL